MGPRNGRKGRAAAAPVGAPATARALPIASPAPTPSRCSSRERRLSPWGDVGRADKGNLQRNWGSLFWSTLRRSTSPIVRPTGSSPAKALPVMRLYSFDSTRL